MKLVKLVASPDLTQLRVPTFRGVLFGNSDLKSEAKSERNPSFLAVVPRGSAMGFLQCLHLILEMWKRLRIQWLQVTVQNRVVGCIEVDVSCMRNRLRRSQKSWKFAPKALNRRTQFATLGRCIMFVGPGSTRLIPCRLEPFPNYFIETSSSLCVRTIAWKTPSWQEPVTPPFRAVRYFLNRHLNTAWW